MAVSITSLKFWSDSVASQYAILNDVIQDGWSGSVTVSGDDVDVSLLANEDYFEQDTEFYWEIVFTDGINDPVTETGTIEKGVTANPVGSGLSVSSTSSPTEATFNAANIGSLSDYGDSIHPYTGNKIQGWEWDKTAWRDKDLANREMVPSIYDASIDGIPSGYFVSGIGGGRDLNLEDVVVDTVSGFNKWNDIARIWTPEVFHGHYFIYQQKGYLHSDDSEYKIVQSINTCSGINTEYNFVDLDYYPKVGVPITARQYKYDTGLGKWLIQRDVRHKAYFTGLRDSNLVRQDTYDSNKKAILYEYIDSANRDEFILIQSGSSNTYPRLVFNKQMSERVGNDVPTSGEFLGYSDGNNNQQFYVEYSPIDPTQPVSIYSYTSGTYESLTPLSGLDSNPSTGEVAIDYDYGIIQFPLSGTVPSGGWSIEAHYNKSVQIEYEPKDTIDIATGLYGDSNPIRKSSDRGFIYLSDENTEVASIVLSSDLENIGGDTYGPLYLGSQNGGIVATVYNIAGNEVEGETIYFEITTSPSVGSFSGNATETSAVSNAYGKARAYYISPSSVDDIGEYITSLGTIDNSPSYTGVSQTTALRLNNLSVEGGIQDILLFKVYTDDPLLGYADLNIDIDDTTGQLEDYYTDFFTDNNIYGPTGLDTLTGDPSTNAIDWESSFREAWNLTQPAIYGSSNRGRKQIVIEDSASDALDPHEYNSSAVAPFQPIDTSNISDGITDVIFDTSTYSLDAPGAANGFYAYFLIAPTAINIQAKVYNTRLKRWIYSNEISIKISIPESMNGLWVVDSLNNIDTSELSDALASMDSADVLNKRVPLGWRLQSKTISLASALGGVCFLDINDSKNPDTWPSLKHKITVNIT